MGIRQTPRVYDYCIIEVVNEHWLPDWRDYDIRSDLAHYEGVRTRKLLFFDSFHLRRHRGLTFHMHQPEKEAGNPILRPEQPWEGWRSFWYGRAVLYDPRLGRYRAWYETRQDSTSPDGNWERAALKRIAYAESDDGVVWRRPSLHQHERDGSTANSIISVGALGMHFANVIIDEHEADPRKRYKMMFYAQPPGRGQAELAEGMQVALSADGLRWWLPVDPHEAPIPSGRSWRAGRTTCADAISLYGWSEQHQRYVAFLKSNDVIPTRFRTICWSESEDFINWSRLVNVLAPDDAAAPGTEFYYMTVFPCADLYVGLLSVYHNYDRRHAAWQPPTVEPPPELAAMNQHLDVRLAFSRDLQVWHQAGGRQAFIPNGPPGAWDAGVCYGSSIVAGKNGELLIYYAGTPMRHAEEDLLHAGTVRAGRLQGIFGGVGRLRPDGFVSLAAGTEPGALETRPVVLSGEPLTANVRCAAGGEATLRLLDAAGRAVSGVAPTRFTGNHLDARIAVPPQIRERLRGSRARLAATLRDAELFSLTV